MEQEENEKRILLHNCINQFILRIDVEPSKSINLPKLADSLKADYQTIKQEIVNNIKVDIVSGNASKESSTSYILDSGQGAILRIVAADNSICLQSSSYETSAIYKDRLLRIIDCLKEQNGQNVNALRIGMRYINNIPCEKINNIQKILNIENAKIIKGMLQKDNISRAIAIEEYIEDICNIRVQYGVPNKFYPSVIRRYDVVLDIDAYASGIQNISDWTEIVSNFNHKAYNTFVSYMNPIFLEKMK